jgi:hypothetical protein
VKIVSKNCLSEDGKFWNIIPVICEETGWYGGNLRYTVPVSVLDFTTASKYAFICLEGQIRDGKLERKDY